MRFDNQLKTFLRILDEYSQDVPLSKFLPVFFRANKQMGSTDRRVASSLIYNYFRIGKACSDLPARDRLLIAEFLCNTSGNSFLEYFNPGFNANIHLSVEEKIDFLKVNNISFKLEDVFPFFSHLSGPVDQPRFLKSLFTQPDLFIRIHPGKEKFVKIKLQDEGIVFKEESEHALRLPNGTKLETLFPEGGGSFEVQDLSSQYTGSYFKPDKWDYWWDACAASGGKSLLLFDQEPSVKLLVSDVRESILANLDQRFQKAGLRQYQKKMIDLTQNPDPILHDFSFDGIILDAPCSGSGTWGRSPEMISQFRENRIISFQNLQRSIIRNVVKYLKPGKPLIYITCSAFREENEDNVDFMVREFGLKAVQQEVLKGYEYKADTMFVARLVR